MKIHFILVLLLLLGVPLIAVPEEKKRITFTTPRKPQVIKGQANGVVFGKLEVEMIDIQQRATRNAHKDAEVSINKPMWFFIGCAPGIGFLSALVYKPPVPISRLIGKSAEYTLVYTEAYNRKMKDLQFGIALAGCITGSIVGGSTLLAVYYSGGIARGTD